MRYLTQINVNRLLIPQTKLNLGYTSLMLTNSFIKVKSLSEDLFCTGNIETLGYCMELYSQFLNKKPLDFFVSGCWEIELACQRMERELEKFLIELEKIFFSLYSLIQNKSKLKKNLHDTKLLFKKNLMKQFKTFIILDGKYSSIYDKLEGIFLERMQYKYFFDKIFSK